MELWEVIENLELDEEYDIEEYCGSPSIIRRLATFYVLDGLSSVDPQLEEIRSAHHQLSATLAEEFLNYTIMACLGEARHADNHAGGFGELSSEAYSLAMLLSQYSDMRGKLYARHRKIVDVLGKEKTLELCFEIFSALEWEGKYGGEPWAQIAQTGLMYLRKQMTPTVYIDTVVNLEHHNECYLDKYYNLTEECCYYHGMYFHRLLAWKNHPEFIDRALEWVCILPEYRSLVLEGYKYYRLTRR